MKTLKVAVILSTFLFIVGCNQGPSQEDYNALVKENEALKSEIVSLKSRLPDFNDYVGKWELTESMWLSGDYNIVSQITRDGETYIIKNNILKNELWYNQNSFSLEKKDGHLSTPNGGSQLSLSKDKKTLRINDRVYQKIDDNRLNEIQQQREEERLKRIKMEEEEKLENAKKEKEQELKREQEKQEDAIFAKNCEALKQEYREKMRPLAISSENSKNYTEIEKIMQKARSITDQYLEKQDTFSETNPRFSCSGISPMFILSSFL